MMIVIMIACLLLVLVLVAENKSLREKLLKIRLEKDLMEHDLHEVSALANGKDDLPITQPYLRNPEAIKVSFEIIRLRLHCDQLQKDLKVFRGNVFATKPIYADVMLKNLANLGRINK